MKSRKRSPAHVSPARGPVARHTIVGIGEMLWDLFPVGKELGGAPANFAYMTGLLGDRGLVASRIGKDRLGNAAARRLVRLGLPTTYLQVDTAHPTGTVNVTVDAAGQPQFAIMEKVAWDYFEWSQQWRALAAETDAVCFGSLAQRSAQSRVTILAFLEALRPGALRIFDVNLRQSFFTKDVLAESLSRTHILKMNEDEFPRVIEILAGPAHDPQTAARWLLQKFQLKLICLTRGAQGSLLVTSDAIDEHPGCSVAVADTVGSGDAFTAALVHKYLRNTPLHTMNEAANRLGAWVASQVGATPPADPAVIAGIHSLGEEEAA